jgi:hypothetical protein
MRSPLRYIAWLPERKLNARRVWAFVHNFTQDTDC